MQSPTELFMKFGIHKIVALAGLIAFSAAAFGQTTDYDNASPPVVVPPSPAAAALFHDIDVPIDYYTGAQKLGIPIYTVKLGSLQVPISLHYRPNGIKVEEDAGWTGLGWDLEAGGAVGRSIIGFPDEDLNFGYRRTAAFLGMPSPGNPSATNSWFTTFSQDLCKQYTLSKGTTMEMSPDNYFINICGNSARLFFDQNAVPYLSPYKPWKITGNEASGYTVVTDDGTIYVLQLIESSTSTVETLPDDHTTPITGNTSWYLTQIISANKTDTINFSYKAVSYNVVSYLPTESMSVAWQNQTSPCGAPTPGPSHSFTTVTHSVTGYVLSAISTRNQRVDFVSNANRDDITDNTKGMPYKLDSIRIFATTRGSADVLLQKFALTFDYYNSGSASSLQRLRLTALTHTDGAGNLPEQYGFTYHDDALPAKTSKAQDQWGYYNGKDANTTLIPSFTDGNGVVQTLADRSVDTTKASLGLLTSIRYPTGGTSSFEYEANRWGQSADLIVPVVVHSETGAVGNGSPSLDRDTFTLASQQTVSIFYSIHEPTGLIGEGLVKIFQVGNNTPVFSSPTITNGTTTSKQLNAGTYYTQAEKGDGETTVSASIRVTYQTTAPSPYVGNPIGGARIKRLVQSDGITAPIVKRFTYLLNDSVSSGNIVGNSVYSAFEYVPQVCTLDDAPYKAGEWTMYGQHSTSVTALGSVHGGNVAYTKVTVLYGDNGENGREENYYNYVQDIGGGGYPYGPPASFDDVRGLLVKKLVFKNDGNLVQKVENTYSVNTNQGDPNFRSIYGVKSGGLHRSPQFGSDGCPTGAGWEFESRLYQVNQFWPTLFSTAETSFSSTGSDSITASTYFVYDNQNTQVAKKAMLSSKADSVILYTTFADGIFSTSIGTEMINRNMLSVPVEYDEYRNQSFVSKKVTNYSIFPSAGKQMVLPENVQLQFGSAALETRQLFNKYDQWGNLLSQNKSGDAVHSYLYDYANTYPIAEIINADSSNVAYTSFEADGTGNWTLGSGTINTGIAFSGNNSFYATSTISKSGLSSDKTYIVSYWSLAGAFGIPGTLAGYPKKGKTININGNSWVFYLHKVTGQSTISLSGQGTLDELRLYPGDAQMTTYTYDPLVGMTSQTDVANRTTYYEYDGLARLKRVRDQDRNILKSLEYQYQSPSGCGNGCYILPMQTFAGSTTLSYPVGVFNVHGQLIQKTVANAAQYISAWNSDTADNHIGTLAGGADSMHFNLTLNAGQTAPAGVTGCRYYQFDLPWSIIDGITYVNGDYVDFGDSTGMRLGSTASDTPAVMPPNTVRGGFTKFDPVWYFIHSYHDTSLKTITLYHSDDWKHQFIDNITFPATSLTKLQNLRGILPQHTATLGGSCYQQGSANTVANIANWNSISSVQAFFPHCGDRENACEHLNFSQDFMQNNRGLQAINATQGNYYQAGIRDTTFKLTRLKTDWNTYFTQLQDLEITDEIWNREDLTPLTKLQNFAIVAGNQNHSNDPTNNPVVPIPQGAIDTIINQIAAGAGQHVNNGQIAIFSGGIGRSHASDASVNFLQSKGWRVLIDGPQP